MSYSESINYELQESPNYYAIIPSDVRYSKKLPPNAKLLYGELTALANRDGYCWASNKYFEILYDVDERTIRNWLESLKKEGFINVDIIKNGMSTQRKIWIVKNNITTRKEISASTGQKIPGRGEKKTPHNTTYSNVEKKTTTTKEKVVVVVDEDKEEKISKSSEEFNVAIKNFAEVHGNNWYLSKYFITSLLRKYGIEYVKDQIIYMWERQKKAVASEENSYKTMKTKKIDDPKTYLSLCCDKNYANSNKREIND